MYIACFLISIGSFLIGWSLAVFRISIDSDIHVLTSEDKKNGYTMQKVGPDDAICKKPQEGYILVSVTPEIARKLVNLPKANSDEMRSLLWNQV